MSAKTARADLTTIAMRKAHNESSLLRAILTETADLTSRSHWTLRAKLQRLRTLAETIRDTGSPALITGHPSVGISLDDDSDYDAPNTHLAACDREED